MLGSSLFFGFPLLSVLGIGITLLELLVDPLSNVAQFDAAAKGVVASPDIKVRKRSWLCDLQGHSVL